MKTLDLLYVTAVVGLRIDGNIVKLISNYIQQRLKQRWNTNEISTINYLASEEKQM